MLSPHEDLRVGILYQGESDIELSGDVDLPADLVGSVDIKLELPLARAVRADAIWDVTDALALSIGGAWEDWGSLEDTDITLGPVESSGRSPPRRLDRRRLVDSVNPRRLSSVVHSSAATLKNLSTSARVARAGAPACRNRRHPRFGTVASSRRCSSR